MDKITIIVHRDDEKDYLQFQENVIQKLNIPSVGGESFSVNVFYVVGDNRATLFNKAMRQSEAKYKIYIGKTVSDLDPNFLVGVINIFLRNKRLGLLGFIGSGMPISGRVCDARRCWGRYFQQGKVGVAYEAPFIYQEVSLIDSQVMATSVDVPWDEECGDEYLGATACLERRRRGIPVAVPMFPGMAFVSNTVSEYDREDWDEASHQKFLHRYREDLQPLVSVLIPAYNEPEYCREALESVLSQDYGNIEILIGDDSTDDRVEKMVLPYLDKYKNISYEHHAKPYGGTDNVYDLLARCHGDFVNILFHDDIFLPNKISKMMSYMVEDVKEEIGFVTSVRYYLRDGELLNDPVGWMFDREYEICGEELAKNIFFTCINAIGEFTTAIFRKNLTYVEGEEKYPYHLGLFCGYEEHTMGDVSTWLNLLSKKKCVFIKEPLSAFRRTTTQNTWKPAIMIQSVLDWLNMIVAAWLHKTFLHTEKDLEESCWGWHDRFKFHILSKAEMFNGELQESLQTFLEEIEAVEQGDFESVIRLAKENMEKHGYSA